MQSKLKIVVPTLEEDTAINAAIAADPDTYELSETAFRRLTSLRSRMAAGTGKKVQVSLRIDADVVDAFKAAAGADWQFKMNAALREWLDAQRAV